MAKKDNAAENAVILCSTARLARSLRLEQGRLRRVQGLTQWHPPTIRTLSQWLDDLVDRAMLTGELPPDFLPRQRLDNMAERLLWERAIAHGTQGEAAQALFDMAGLAQSAAEAHRLLVEWNVPLAAGEQTEEK